MNIILGQIKRLDWGLVVPAILLVCFGLTALYSVAIAKGDFSNFSKQIIFLAVGLFIMLAVSFFDYRILRNNSYLILVLYGICLLLLL